MVGRYRQFDLKGNLLVLPYEFLKTRSIAVLQDSQVPFDRCSRRNEYEPRIDRVNVARESRWTSVTRFLSANSNCGEAETTALVVNFAKHLGIHRLFEKKIDVREFEAMREKVAGCIVSRHSASVEIYVRLRSELFER